MLLSFRVRNYRSFRDEQELTFTRSRRMASHRGASEVPEDPNRNEPLVTSVVGIYGSNASGKSNILNAIDFMSDTVRESYSKWLPDSDIPFEPFALDPQCAKEPSAFEAEVLIDGIRYQYGFELDSARIRKEYIYAYPHGRRQTWLERTHDDVEEWYFGKSLSGQNHVIREITRSNCLFLSAAASAKHRKLGRLYHWLSYHIRVATPDNYNARMIFTTREVAKCPEVLDKIKSILKAADIGICDLRVQKTTISIEEAQRLRQIANALRPQGAKAIPEEIPSDLLDEVGTSLELWHSSEGGKEPVALSFDSESLGTRALIALAGPVLQALRNSSTMLIDEIDSSLHPRLVSELVKLFGSPTTNPKGAQLVFSSHDTSLLGNLVDEHAPLERDQIWFVQKDSRGASHLYPLTDFKARKMENWERGYLQGRYGAIPYVAINAIGPISVQENDDYEGAHDDYESDR